MENLLSVTQKQEQYVEPVIYTAKLHWILNVLPIIGIVLGLFAALLIFASKGYPILFFMEYFLLYIGFKSTMNFLNNRFTKIQLKENSVTLTQGILSKSINDIALVKMEALYVNQSLLGRMLNYGTLIISTGQISHIYTIANPNQLRSEIMKLQNSKY